MSQLIKRLFKKESNGIKSWAQDRLVGLFIFNVIVMLLILLQSAGYFSPFFPLSINTIVMISLISSIFLLGTNSKASFILTLLFWLFASFLKIVKIDVWAERTVIYAYQALIVGLVLLIIETILAKKGTSDD